MISQELPAFTRLASKFNAPLAIVLGGLALTTLLYWPTSIEIVDLWQDDQLLRYSHGQLVLAVTVWLLWRDRAQLALIGLQPSRFGWCLVALGSLGWLIGFNAGLLAFTMLAMPLLALAAIWAAAGSTLARRVAFAVFYLYFSLPLWELFNPVLQSLTANVNLGLTRLVGIPVSMEGNFIQIPAGSFEIGGGCSGLHFFMVALAIAALQGEIDRDNSRSRWLLIGIAVALALVTNWLRVFILIVAGHFTDMQHFLVRTDHYYFGWFLFAFSVGLYLYLSSCMPRGDQNSSPSIAQEVKVARVQQFTAAVLAAAALAVGPVWLFAGVAKAHPVAETAPPVIEGWSGPGLYLSPWRPAFTNPDEEFLAAYSSESAGEVAVYRAVHHSQRQGKELRGYGSTVLGEHYQLKESHQRQIALARGSVAISEQIATGANGNELIVWSLFAVDGQPDPMGLLGQLAYGVRSLVRYPTASVVAIAAECRADCDHARSALEAMAYGVMPKLLSSPETARAAVLGPGGK